jgi:Kef-type K+ transport system membrane component KefB/nucleotide-binding universal stress UspA family protein
VDGDALHLLAQLAVLLVTARLLGEAAARIGQAPMVGELAAGVLLGPSLLSTAYPGLGEWLSPDPQELLPALASVGLVLLVTLIGLETDPSLVRRRGRPAVRVATGALVVPLLGGWLVAASDRNLAAAETWFVAAVVAVSAVPVLAKLLMDLDLMRREVGQTMLAAGMVVHVAVWSLVGLTLLLDSYTSPVVALGVGVGFGAFAVVVGRPLVRWLVSQVQDNFRLANRLLTLVVVVALGLGWAAGAVGIHPVVGVFTAGVLFGRIRRLPIDVTHRFEAMTLGVFAPIFLAYSGLAVDLRLLGDPGVAVRAVVLVAVAVIAKMVGAYGAARVVADQSHWAAATFAAGLTARGAVAVVVTVVGASAGLVSDTTYTVLLTMTLVTTMLAPWLLRLTAPRLHAQGAPARIDAPPRPFVAGLRRILIPARPRLDFAGDVQAVEAMVLDRVAVPNGISITLLTVTEPEGRDVAARYLSRLRGQFGGSADIGTRVVVGGDPVDAIIREAANDHDLMIVGAPAVDATEASLFGPVIDDLVKLSPCPTLIIKCGDLPDDWSPERILVPTDGSMAARHAADLAFALSGPGTLVTGVHVVVPTRTGAGSDRFARDVTAEMEGIALAIDRTIDTEVVHASDPATGILETIEARGADLVILGTSVKAGSSRLFLSPRVEQIAREASCPVFILNE